jgi:hypothetical protein
MAESTESVYTNRADKFTLISTTVTEISDFNNLHIHFYGCEEYVRFIAETYRTCLFGIESWSSIRWYTMKACDAWNALIVLPHKDFLKLPKYDPLRLKIPALRIMLNNFSDSPSDDDTRYWKFENNKLIVFDPPGENPPSTEPPALRDNPATRHHPHLVRQPGNNPGRPQDTQLIHMLERVQYRCDRS